MERMSALEFVRWVAYFQLKPPGDRLVASMLYNVNRRTEAPFIEPGDFMNAISQQKKQERHEQLSQSPKEIAAMLEAAAPKERRKKQAKDTK